MILSSTEMSRCRRSVHMAHILAAHGTGAP
jgi:hypothetical protein